MRLMIVSLLTLACAVAQAGEVYKWKDKDGRVHYGDKPKHEAQAVDVGPDDAAPSADPTQLAARTADCDRLKKQYEVYSKAPSINETDNLGRTREYTPEERTKFLEQSQKKMQDACAPATP